MLPERGDDSGGPVAVMTHKGDYYAGMVHALSSNSNEGPRCPPYAKVAVAVAPGFVKSYPSPSNDPMPAELRFALKMGDDGSCFCCPR